MCQNDRGLIIIMQTKLMSKTGVHWAFAHVMVALDNLFDNCNKPKTISHQCSFNSFLPNNDNKDNTINTALMIQMQLIITLT